MFNKLYSVKINDYILYFRTNDFIHLAQYLSKRCYDYEIRSIKLLKRIYRKTDIITII